MPFAGTSDEFDRLAAPQRFQFLADPAGRRHEGDETRLVALEPVTSLKIIGQQMM